MPQLQLDRRTYLAALGATVGASAIPMESAAQPASGDWPMSGGGPANTGFSPDDGYPVDGVTVGATTDVSVVGQPVVVDGTVYTAGDTEPAHVDWGSRAGDEDGRVRARPVGSSSVTWERTFEGGVTGTPAVADDTVVVTHWSGIIRALDAADGETIWTTEGDERPEPPVIADGTVFVTTSDGTPTLSAYDLASGERRWGDTGDSLKTVRPAVAEGTLYAVYNSVVAYDAETGERRWESEADGGMVPPIVTDDAVYVFHNRSPSHSVLEAVSTDDGALEWSVKLDAEIDTVPATDGDGLYAALLDQTVSRFDPGTGDREWSGDTVGHPRGPLVVTDGAVYASCDQEFCYAFDPSDGTELWRARLRERASLSLAAGSLFAGSRDGLTRFDPGTRDFVATDVSDRATAAWRERVDVNTDSGLAANEHGLFFTNGYSDVYAYRRDGQDSWKADLPFLQSITSDPVAVGDRVIFGMDGARVRALDATSGIDAWEVEVDATVRERPVVGEDQVVIAADDTLVSLDPVTGDTNWRQTLPVSASEVWGFHDNTLYVRTGRMVRTFHTGGAPDWRSGVAQLEHAMSMAADRHRVYVGGHYGVAAIDADGGDPAWSHEREAPVFSNLVTDGDAVYGGDLGGTLFALDASNGQEYWSLDTPGPFRSEAILLDDMLVIGNEAEQLLFVDRKTGQRVASYDATAPISARPATGEDRVFVLDQHGTLHAVEVPTNDAGGGGTAGPAQGTSPAEGTGPGFTALGGIAGVLGAGALLKRYREG